MKRLLIASDFDGTIGTGARLQEDLDAIDAFRARGHLFGLISGRNNAGLRAMRQRFGVPCDFLMSDNGGVCYVGEELLFSHQMGAEYFFPLADFLLFEGSDMVAVNRNDGVDMLFYRDEQGNITEQIQRDRWVPRPFSQMSGIFRDPAHCLAMAEKAKTCFPYLTALPSDDCLDLVPKGRDKAAGVAELAAHFQIDEGDVYVVGDNYNDLAMLDAFPSFVVENAPEDVKKHATEGITPSVGAMIKKILARTAGQ